MELPSARQWASSIEKYWGYRRFGLFGMVTCWEALFRKAVLKR